ncbi:MAG: ABC transporter permease, partial [Anaerolineae bacterium]|nr:ABC transporter permease [Anaerolineae bacterium]
MAIVFGAAIFAPWLTRYDPQALVALPFLSPGANHLLGTDDLGHDIFSQLIYGARLSLVIGLAAALFACGVGLVVALIAGYFRGVIEITLMRIVDIVLAFPFLPLVIVLAAFLGRSLLVTIVVIAAVIWARPA